MDWFWFTTTVLMMAGWAKASARCRKISSLARQIASRASALRDATANPEAAAQSRRRPSSRLIPVTTHSSTGFEPWFQNQSHEVQDDIMGADRAEAWRSGKMSIEQLLSWVPNGS